MSEEKLRAYRLADNRVGEESSWSDELLRLEVADLDAMGMDLSALGFTPAELGGLLFDAPVSAEAEQTPALPDKAKTQPGDIWTLGRHRLICGDATKSVVVEPLLAGQKPKLMVTDPPYGVDYDPTWRARAGVNKNKGKLGTVVNDHIADWREAWALFPGSAAYVWHAGLFASTVEASLKAAGLEPRSQIIWAKDRFALGRGHYHWQHEPCWYAVRGQAAHWNNDRTQSTLWTIRAREDSGLGHGTQKPVECMRRPMINSSPRGALVYDPFCGSGTTIIAAEMTDRSALCCEIDPRYCDVAVKRWERFTGLKAKRSRSVAAAA